MTTALKWALFGANVALSASVFINGIEGIKYAIIFVGIILFFNNLLTTLK